MPGGRRLQSNSKRNKEIAMGNKSNRRSLHGRKVQYDDTNIFVGGRSIGTLGPIGNGNVWFVDSAVDGADGRSPDQAVGTLDEAFALVTENNGDVIYVMPNHAETVTGVAGIAADKAGVTVIGLGQGNQRPRFLMDGATTVTMVVSAADMTFENLVFAGGHNGIVTCIDVTAVNATFRKIEFEDNTTDEHFLVAFSATGAANSADGLTIEDCKWVSVDTGITDFVSLTDDCNRLTMRNNYMCVDAATGAGMLLCATGKDVTGLAFEGNILVCGNTSTDLLIDNDTTANTGYAAFNFCRHHDTAASVLIDCDGIGLWENYQASSDTESGVLQPAADTNT
jgi:hypothetical protein